MGLWAFEASNKGYYMRNVFVLLTLRGFSFKYGGSPSTISIAMIPRDQMSTLGPYCFRVTTSGAIQYGVPTIVERLFCSGEICAQKPKSAVLCVCVCVYVHVCACMCICIHVSAYMYMRERESTISLYRDSHLNFLSTFETGSQVERITSRVCF